MSFWLAAYLDKKKIDFFDDIPVFNVWKQEFLSEIISATELYDRGVALGIIPGNRNNLAITSDCKEKDWREQKMRCAKNK